MKYIISIFLCTNALAYGVDGPTGCPPPEQPKGMNGPAAPPEHR